MNTLKPLDPPKFKSQSYEPLVQSRGTRLSEQMAAVPAPKSTNSVVDEAGSQSRSAARTRICVIGVAMLLVSILIGTTVGEYGYTPLVSEVVKVVAVAIFVGAMIALAMSMIGEISNGE